MYDIAGIPLNTDISEEQKNRKQIVKRIFDIVVALFGLIVLSPILIFIAIVIKLESRGSIFFKQRRSLADGGKEFDFIKFRSMNVNANEQKNNFREHNEANGALFKIRDDPRRTAVGKFLRRHAYKGHLLMHKSKKQKRKLSQRLCVSVSDSQPIKLMLPY